MYSLRFLESASIHEAFFNRSCSKENSPERSRIPYNARIVYATSNPKWKRPLKYSPHLDQVGIRGQVRLAALRSSFPQAGP